MTEEERQYLENIAFLEFLQSPGGAAIAVACHRGVLLPDVGVDAMTALVRDEIDDLVDWQMSWPTDAGCDTYRELVEEIDDLAYVCHPRRAEFDYYIDGCMVWDAKSGLSVEDCDKITVDAIIE